MRASFEVSPCVAARIRSPTDLKNAKSYGNPGAGRFGFWWWYWVPYIGTNGGRPWRDRCSQITILWLCFSLLFGWWNHDEREGDDA